MKNIHYIIKMLTTLSLIFSLSGCKKEEKPPITAEAYYIAFENIYNYDDVLNHEINYIAVDLSNVLLSDTQPLIDALNEFCNKKDYLLLLDTWKGLKEKGYAWAPDYAPFMEGLEHGILITFIDSVLTKNELSITTEKFRSPGGSICNEYVFIFNNKNWELIEEIFVYMS